MNHARILMFSGTALFLSGCIVAGLTGFNLFKNYRAAVGGHVEAQLNGMFLLLIGVAWHYLRLGSTSKIIAHVSIELAAWIHPWIYYWVAYTGHFYPILRLATADGITQPSSTEEAIISFLLIGVVSCMMILALVFLLWGFRGMIEPDENTIPTVHRQSSIDRKRL